MSPTIPFKQQAYRTVSFEKREKEEKEEKKRGVNRVTCRQAPGSRSPRSHPHPHRVVRGCNPPPPPGPFSLPFPPSRSPSLPFSILSSHLSSARLPSHHHTPFPTRPPSSHLLPSYRRPSNVSLSFSHSDPSHFTLHFAPNMFAPAKIALAGLLAATAAAAFEVSFPNSNGGYWVVGTNNTLNWGGECCADER